VSADGDADRIVACVNLMAGVDAARLDPSDPAVCMFLAYLRGDETAAVAWADEVQARCNAGEGYVSRAELERRNAELRAAWKSQEAKILELSDTVLKNYHADREERAELRSRFGGH
jgi:hypothetical protein